MVLLVEPDLWGKLSVRWQPFLKGKKRGQNVADFQLYCTVYCKCAMLESPGLLDFIISMVQLDFSSARWLSEKSGELATTAELLRHPQATEVAP